MLSNQHNGVDVRVKSDNSSQTLVTLGGYKPGLAPVLLVNDTPSWTVEYGDTGSAGRKLLGPAEKVLFTWEKPSGSRTLAWTLHNIPGVKVMENSLKTDEFGEFRVGAGHLAWVSFLDGMQRVLLFTSQPLLAQQLAKTRGESERIDLEVEVCIPAPDCCVLLCMVQVSIFGVGLSLVNNDRAVRRELVISVSVLVL